MKHITVGFANNEISYLVQEPFRERLICYKEFYENGRIFELYNRNGRNYCARVSWKNLRLSAQGPTARNWNFVFMDEKLKPKYCFIQKENDVIMTFEDFEQICEEKKEKEEKAKESRLLEAEKYFELAIEQNQSIYSAIKDKKLFAWEMVEDIKELLFDAELEPKDFLKDAHAYFENFLKSEQEMECFIRQLTVQQVIEEYPRVKEYELSSCELVDAVQKAINRLIEEECWGPLNTDYKEAIYSDIEIEVRQCAEEKKRSELKNKLSLEEVLKIFDSKIKISNQQEKIKSQIAETLERALNWNWGITEQAILYEVDTAITRFLEDEKVEQKIDEFYINWPTGEKIIELTPEKMNVFLCIENGECIDQGFIKEYELYKELYEEYNQFIYRKKGKGLKPTFAAIPAYNDLFNNLVKFALKANIINEDYSFNNFDGIEVFKKELKKYERSVAKK